jgi:hypothetical protein
MMTGMLFSSGGILQLGEHGHAVHDGHGDIEHDEVGFCGGGGGQAFLAVAGFEHHGVVGIEGPLDDHADGFAVIHAENFYWHSFNLD